MQGLEIAELHAFEFGGEVLPVGVALEARLVDGHQRLERPDQPAGLGQRLAPHRRAHHRRRRLADRAALPADADVGHGVAVDVDVEDDLVAAQRVEPLELAGRGHRQLTAVPGGAVVVENDLPVQVLEASHLVSLFS